MGTAQAPSPCVPPGCSSVNAAGSTYRVRYNRYCQTNAHRMRYALYRGLAGSSD